MFKKIAAFGLGLLLFFPTITYAIGWLSLLNKLAEVYGVNLDMKELDKDQLGTMKNVAASLSGTHNYGSQYYNADNYGWGGGAKDWQAILAMSKKGGGNGALGDIISELAKQFPISGGLNSTNPIENQYYDLQARNALAERASSELAYKQAIQAEHTMTNLHGLIDKTNDNKSAVDLNNRLAAENGMNSVQQTKLLAILVQQAALQAQEKANRAKEDQAFFDIK